MYLTNRSAAMKKECFDLDWQFSRGDFKDGQSPEFNSEKWENIDLPHDFAIQGPFTLDENQEENPQDFAQWETENGYKDWQTGHFNGYLPDGIGWYRKSFMLSHNAENKKIFVEFEGIYRNADIWLNGVHLKNQRNGYLGFHLDITEYVQFDEPNILAVRCDNSTPDTSRWYTGSGIYRHCYLYSCENIYIPHNGIYITTPNVTLDSASVQLNAEIRNTSAKKEFCTLNINIVNKYNLIISSFKNVFEVEAGDSFIANSSFAITNPLLWCVDSPNLHTAIVKLSIGEKIIGEYSAEFGIRKIEFVPKKGMLLNGQPIITKGVNLHHDLGACGAAAFDSAIFRRLKLIKDMGCNAIRLSHNPHAPALLTMCDRMGILVFAEAFDKLTNQYYGDDVDFEQVWQDDLKAFIERDRNHPCIFIWSVGNEIAQQRFGEDYGVDILRRMIAFVHQTEPSRKVTCALYPARRDGITPGIEGFSQSEPAQMAFHMDVLSCNYTWKFFEEDMKKYPQFIPIQSEAAVGENNLGGWTDYDKTGIAGHFFWGGTDYLGESLAWPYKGWYRGFADICGIRKPISYQLEAAFSDKSVVHISVDFEGSSTKAVWNDAELKWRNIVSHWNWLKGDTLQVQVYSNQKSVELFLNGESLGKKTMDNKHYIFSWNVRYESGILLAVGFDEEDKIISSHQIATAEEKYKIVLEPEQHIIQADDQDVVHITAKVTDRNGIICPYADDLLRFSLEGAGSLIGVSSGNLKSGESFSNSECKAYMGRAQLIIRSKRVSGSILITAKASNLLGDETTILVL